MKKILFPVEGMTVSDKAVAMASEFGQLAGAEIVILHVQPYGEAIAYPYAHLAEPWDEEALNKVSERIISQTRGMFPSDVKLSTRVVSGDPASEILEIAGEEGCDLIVMSTHGMGTITRFLLGSVTNKVVHHSKVPVLVVR